MKNKFDLWDTIKAALYQATWIDLREAIKKRSNELVADPELILDEAWEKSKIDSEKHPKLYISNRKLTKEEIQHGFKVAERLKKLDKSS